MKTLVLLDLDRTAFKTDEHFRDFCAIISTQFNIDVNQLREREHRITEKPGPYSPIDDIRYNESIQVEPSEVISFVSHKMKDDNKNYLYPDVIPFLKWHAEQNNPVVVITVGTHEYQTLKLSLADELAGFPRIITRESKARVLTDSLHFIENGGVLLKTDEFNIEADNAILIDDRAGTFKDVIPMPDDSRLELVRIKRQDAAHSETETPEDIREIKALTELITR